MHTDVSHRMASIIEDLESSGNLVSAAHVQMALDALCLNAPFSGHGGACFTPIFTALVPITAGSLTDDDADYV